MIKTFTTFIAALIAGAAVTAWLATSHATQPGPAVENPVLRAASDCTYPFHDATWDNGEAPTSVNYVGDSLMGQVGPELTLLGQQRCHTSDVWANPGSAPCDFGPDYGSHIQPLAPRNVSFGFVGNATSACMLAHLGWAYIPAHLTADQISLIGYWYEVDLRALVRWNLANNIRTFLILPPEMNRGTWHGQMTDELIARYTRIADSYGGVGVDDGPRTVLTPGGVYRATVTLDGHAVTLRHTDGTHLAAPMGTWW